MPNTTNLLGEQIKRRFLPFAGCAVLLIALALFSYSPVKAALSPSSSPLSDNSVAALTSLDQAMETVAARVTPAVVNIAVTSHAPEQAEMQGNSQDGQDGNPMEQFRRFFGPGFNFGPPQQQQQQQIEHGIGSGIIISPDGYIVTNNHVVNGAMQIRVTLHDRRTFAAKLIGTDKLTDLAVIKIDASNLPTVSWGNSADLRPGQTVLAFGSPFGYFEFSVTRGIVSALNRPNPYSDDAHKPGGFIQTDAAINPGNSGGPLVDAHGQVIGINTFLISDSGSFAGAGFAIPSQIARPITASLIRYGKVEHGYLGIGINDVTPDNAKFFDLSTTSGAVVSQVTPDSPASRAGLRVGDVITGLDGQQINTASDLQMAVSDSHPGTQVVLDVMRNGSSRKVTVGLGELNGAHEVAAVANGSENQGRLGVAVTDLTPDVRQQLNLPDNVQGVAVQQVRPGSPAEDAGLSQGDVILQVDRQPVQSSEAFRNDVDQVPVGKDLMLLVWSNGGASYRVLHTGGPNS